MRKYLLIFISIIALDTAHAQERSFVPKKFDHFTVDLLDNLYGWNDEGLEKYTPTGELTASYSNKSLGPITAVDVSIPSKIMVFYQESGTIQILDSKLSPLGNSLDLFGKGLFSISLAAISSSTSIVLFDVSTQELISSDLNLNITHTTPCNFSKEFQPNLINIRLDNEILLIDRSGLYFFDKFGSFEKQIAITDITSSQYYKKRLFYLQYDQLYKYDILTLERETISTREVAVKEFHISNDYIYLLDKSGSIFKYQIKE